MINPADTITIIQARLESTRLPSKVLYPFGSGSILTTIIESCQQMGPEIVLLGTAASNRVLEPLARQSKIKYFSGNTGSPLQDFLDASRGYPYINRICADAPFMSAPLTRYLLLWGHEASDIIVMKGVPHGLTGTVVKRKALVRLMKSAPTAEEHQHVTLGVMTRPEFTVEWVDPEDLSVDTIEDYTRVRELLV